MIGPLAAQRRRRTTRIPDLAVVDADYRGPPRREQLPTTPSVFRLVLEVTSSNYKNDLRNKVSDAEAKSR